MKKNSNLLSILMVLLSVCITAHADQGPPYPMVESFDEVTAIVDATVKELTPEGAAKIEIHRVLKGPKDVPTMILGSMNDTDQLDAASHDVKTGERYILFLTENRLTNYGFHGLHAFTIRKNDKGKLECLYKRYEPDANGSYSFSSPFVESWEPLEDFVARIKKILKNRPYPIAESFAEPTAIVDATVKELTPEGAAKIEIHRVLRGPKDVPTMILGSMNDTKRLMAASRDVKTGERYILLLTENRLANYGDHGLHAFKIRKNDKGKLECLYKHYEPDENGSYWFSSPLVESWEPLEDFEARIKKALEK